jgi:hypothetical protein
MSTRTAGLAAQFQQLHSEFVKAITALADEDWHKIPEGELRPVSAIAYHTANGYTLTFSFVEVVAKGLVVPAPDAATMHQINAQQAAEHAGISKEEVLDLLDRNYALVAEGIEKLSDADLDCTGMLFGYQLTGQLVIEGIVLRHIRDHLATVLSVVIAPVH